MTKDVYYPSTEEKRVVVEIEERLTKELRLEEPIYIWDEGAVARISDNTLVGVKITSAAADDMWVTVFVENGLFVYYRIENGKKVYLVSKTERQRNSVHEPVRKGRWGTVEIMEEGLGENSEDYLEDEEWEDEVFEEEPDELARQFEAKKEKERREQELRDAAWRNMMIGYAIGRDRS